MSGKKVLKIGVASRDRIKARSLAIARGEIKPVRGEPKVWFTSMESVAQVLSSRNLLLLELISRTEPASITELAARSGRQKSNLSRTLRTMERYGLVQLEKQPGGKLAPRVTHDRVELIAPLNAAGR